MIIGLDVGGTNIDAVIIKDGYILNKIKRPVDFCNLFESIWLTLKELMDGYDKNEIKRINLSTTVSTNAIIEEKTSPVGMIIQSGPGMEADFLKVGKENIFISGYVDHRGEIITKFKEEEIEAAIKLFLNENINACAVVTKFSPRNPSVELKVEKILKNHMASITLGHRLSGKLNFPRRVNTSYLNSAVNATFNNFSLNIEKALKKEGINAPVFILKADGGIMDLNTARELPVESILSGPAASFMGIQAMLKTTQDAILLDIGGTTTDIFFLANGVPLFEPIGIKIGEFKTLVRALYSVSLGLGGDSSISLKDNKITIGPKKEGPPCAFGGVIPTPTDAMISLGLMDGGNKKKASDAMKSIAKELGLSMEDTSRYVLEIMALTIKKKVDVLLQEINAQPVYTVKELLFGKKIEPKVIHIVGGPAKILSEILSDKFDLPCIFPNDYKIANAIGAALSQITTEITLVANTTEGTMSVPELGIFEIIKKNFSLNDAKAKALEFLNTKIMLQGATLKEFETEIIEESSFNMVKGFSATGKNIRIKAQTKPGFFQQLKGGE